MGCESGAAAFTPHYMDFIKANPNDPAALLKWMIFVYNILIFLVDLIEKRKLDKWLRKLVGFCWELWLCWLGW